MAKQANPPIGTCPCPHRGCDRTATVKKFAHRSTTDQGRRLAGKLYLDCPDHGRFGTDGKPAAQEWILDHASIDGAPPAKSVTAPGAAAATAPAKPATAPASVPAAAPAAAPAAPQRSGFRTLMG